MRRAVQTSLLCFVCLGAFAVPASAAPSIESASFSLSSKQAGAHADLTVSVALKEAGDPETAKTLRLGLPPGHFLYPDTGPGCSSAAFGAGTCPIGSQVGIVELAGDHEGDPDHEFAPAPLYLLTPADGEMARLGFVIPAVGVPVVAPVTVRGTDQGLDLEFGSFPQTVPLTGIAVSLWGVPAAAIHDELRGGPSNVPETPLLRNPTSCGALGSLGVTAESWEKPGESATLATATPAIGGCEKLAFHPALSAELGSAETSAPTGLELGFTLPADLTPQGLSGSDAETVDFTLPPELGLDEGILAGLPTCSVAQAHLEGGPNECPSGSALGAVQGSVAGVDAPLAGSVYFGGAEPSGAYRLFLVAAGGGVGLRRQATVAYAEADEAWVIDLPNLPQLPIDSLELEVAVAGGPFVTPPECGSFDLVGDFAPWSDGPGVRALRGLKTETGPGGGPCPGPTEEVPGSAPPTQTAPAPPPIPAANPLPPAVKLRGRPAKETLDRTPTFRFVSTVPGSSFRCKLDKRPLRSCRSPLTLSQLAFGRHSFKVRAIAPSGLASAFVSYGFVVRRPGS